MSRESQRKSIRNAIKAKLSSGTDCGDRVYTNRFEPIFDKTYPLMLIYTLDEAASQWAEAPREYERRLRVAIEIVTKKNSPSVEVDDLLDDVCQQIEDKLALDHTLGEICSDIIPQGTEYQSSIEGDSAVAAARMTYEVKYYSVEVAITDETELQDFRVLNTTIKDPNKTVDDTPVIESSVELETE